MFGSGTYLAILGSFLLLGLFRAPRTWISRQRWIHRALAAFAIAAAMDLGIQAVKIKGIGPIRGSLAVLGGMLLGPWIGRLLRLQERWNAPAHWAAQRLPSLPSLSTLDATKVHLALLALNPAGWLAAWVLGVSGNPLSLIWKALIDGVTLLGLASGRPIPAVLACIGTAGVQSAAWWFGWASQSWMESQGCAAPALLAASLVWMTLPLVVLGISKVPLARLVIAVPVTVLLAACLG